jgi:hypothetical protein
MSGFSNDKSDMLGDHEAWVYSDALPQFNHIG